MINLTFTITKSNKKCYCYKMLWNIIFS